MPPTAAATTPQELTKKLKSIRLVISGDITPWMNKVRDMIANGADVRVLDNYKGNGSIINAFLSSEMGTGDDTARLKIIIKFLFEQGVAPTPEVFANCLWHSTDVAEVVMRASGNTINVNTLTIYDVPIHTWVVRRLFSKEITTAYNMKETLKYLKTKGFNTSQKTMSIDDIQEIQSKAHLTH